MQSVSAATRDAGSWARMASRMASEIWSRDLVGMAFGNRFGREQELAFHSDSPLSALRARHFTKDRAAIRPHLETPLPPARPAAARRQPRARRLRRPPRLSPCRRATAAAPCENLARERRCAASDEDVARLARENAAEIGKGATELAWALFRARRRSSAPSSRTHGWDAVERLRAGEPPDHLRDAAPRAATTSPAATSGRRLPILAMYRPHKIVWLDQLLREGRNRGAAPDGTNVAPANLAGVRMVLKHLRRGGCSVVLPDQVPGAGRGRVGRVLRPARLHHDAARAPAGGLGRGARVLLRRAPAARRGLRAALRRRSTSRCPRTARAAARQVNAMVERLVRTARRSTCGATTATSAPRARRPRPAASAGRAEMAAALRCSARGSASSSSGWSTSCPMRWIGAIGAGLGCAALPLRPRPRDARQPRAVLSRDARGRAHALGLQHFRMLGRNARRALASWCGARERAAAAS